MSGFFGCISKQDCVYDLFYGTDYNSGLGIISDLEASPIIANSHLGRFAVAMVGRINNLEELVERALKKKIHFAELSQGGVNPTELISVLICEGKSFKDGIRNVQERVKGSCSLLILTSEGIYAARDKYGRAPIVIGKKKGSYARATHTTSFF